MSGLVKFLKGKFRKNTEKSLYCQFKTCLPQGYAISKGAQTEGPSLKAEKSKISPWPRANTLTHFTFHTHELRILRSTRPRFSQPFKSAYTVYTTAQLLLMSQYSSPLFLLSSSSPISDAVFCVRSYGAIRAACLFTYVCIYPSMLCDSEISNVLQNRLGFFSWSLTYVVTVVDFA